VKGDAQAIIRDYGGVAGIVRGWMYGGRILSSNGTPASPPDVNLIYHDFIFERSATPVFLDTPVWAERGVPIVFTVYCRKDATGMTEMPKFEIINPNAAVFAAESVLATVSMDDTANTWQVKSLRYVPTYSRMLTFRARGRNGSGNLWAGWKRHQPGARG
jgi:hypothetical protein